MKVALTGIMSVKAVADGAHDPYGHLVAKNMAAVHHQHFFNFRLDMDVDGRPNRVVEMNSAPVPAGPQNPYGGAFTMQETAARDGAQAQRKIEPGEQPPLDRAEHVREECARPADRLRAAARRKRGAVPASGRVGAQARRFPERARLGDALQRRRDAMRPATIPIRARAATACRSGPPPTGRSTTATWCSGTRWASRTIRVPKTGR